MDMLYAIDDLNDKDNLDVIMMGLMNTMDGVKIDLGDDQIFDFGAVVDGITDVLSAYYFVLPVALQELNGDFENITFYVVPNDDHIEMQVSDMASLEKIKQSNTIRERMIQEVSGMIFNLVRDLLNGTFTAIEAAAVPEGSLTLPRLATWSVNEDNAYQYREKVAAYEQLQADYAYWVEGGYQDVFSSEAQSLLATPNDALACAVYLAFEQAIIANANNATLDLAGLMSLMGGMTALGGMMEPIAGALSINTSELTGNAATSVAAQFPNQNLSECDSGAVAAATAMFTAIELTNALNGALGEALTSEDAASLGGLLSLFARMLIGNGIGSHPTANGHETLFNEIMEVYPDKPAKEKLIEMAKEYGEKLYDLAYSHNFADVKTTDYYNNAVAWAATNKITEGTSATTFSPNNDCLRGQIVTFLYRNFVK